MFFLILNVFYILGFFVGWDVLIISGGDGYEDFRVSFVSEFVG